MADSLVHRLKHGICHRGLLLCFRGGVYIGLKHKKWHRRVKVCFNPLSTAPLQTQKVSLSHKAFSERSDRACRPARRLLPPAPLPEAPPQGRGWGGVMWNKLRRVASCDSATYRGVWGEGNVGRRSPFTQSTKKPSLSWLGEFSCGQWDNYRTNYEDLIAVYSFGLQIDGAMQP